MDGNNGTQFYTYSSNAQFETALTIAFNATTGQQYWAKKLGIYSNYGTELILVGDDLLFCSISLALTGNGYYRGFVLNQNSLNLGSLGVVRVNSTTGDYISHASLIGTGTTYGCGDAATQGNDALFALQGISYNNAYSTTTAVSLIRVDGQNNFNHIYTLTGTLGAEFFPSNANGCFGSKQRKLSIRGHGRRGWSWILFPARRLR